MRLARGGAVVLLSAAMQTAGSSCNANRIEWAHVREGAAADGAESNGLLLWADANANRKRIGKCKIVN